MPLTHIRTVPHDRLLGALCTFLFFAALVPISLARDDPAASDDPPRETQSVTLIGTSDGRIHIIPSLTPYSIKDGDSLTISAIVRSEHPVASVEAELGGLATVILRPDATRGGVSADATTGVWTGQWRAQGLEERIYNVALTVTDAAGHSFTDGTLTFTDPIAGHSEPGTTDYPNAGMRRLDREVFLTERDLEAAVIDTENGYAYFGTRTSPGRVVKVALGHVASHGEGTEPARRVGAITLEDGENYLVSAVIDPASGYAYFGTNTAPGRVVKVALGEGDEPPRRVNSALTVSTMWVGGSPLHVHHNKLSSAVIDAENGYAYFGTDTAPGRVVKVALGEGNAPPQVAGYRVLEEGENYLRAAVVDIEAGFAYFTTYTNPGWLVKVALGEGDAPPERIGAAWLAVMVYNPIAGIWMVMPDGHPASAVINTASGHVYIGTDREPGGVVKVAVGEGDAPPERLNRIWLEPGEGFLRSAAIHPDSPLGPAAFFGTGFGHGELQGKVITVGLGAGDQPPERLTAMEVGGWGEEQYLHSALIDPANLALYLGTYTGQDAFPGRVVKMKAAPADTLPFFISSLVLQASQGFVSGGNERELISAVITPAEDQVFFGSASSPGRAVKLGVGGPEKPPARLGATSLPLIPSAARLQCGVIEPMRRYAYFGTGTSPGRVLKVALGDGEEPPYLVASLELVPGEDDLHSAVLYPRVGGGSVAYFGTNTDPGMVVAVVAADGDSPPIRTGTLTLAEGENYLTSAVIDIENGYSYFGTNTAPGRVVKVRTAGVGTLERVGAARLLLVHHDDLVDREDYLTSAVIDPENGYAYFGTNTDPGRVAMVGLGEGNAPPFRVGRITLEPGETHLLSAVRDAETNRAYFGTGTSPGQVVAMQLRGGGQPPVRVGSLELPGAERHLAAAAVGLTQGHAYFGTAEAGTPGRAVRVALGQKGFLKGTRFEMLEPGIVESVNIFSHAGEGSLRLAIYADGEPKQLLWQSDIVPVEAAEEINSYTIEDGTPKFLHLPAGSYWLAWQTDTNIPVTSYTQGAQGEGFLIPLSFGPAPGSLQQYEITLTSERWTSFITYYPGELTPGDVNHDGCVDFQDFMLLLEHWGGDYMGAPMDFSTFLQMLENWGVGC